MKASGGASDANSPKVEADRLTFGKARCKETNLLFKVGVDLHWEDLTEQTAANCLIFVFQSQRTI